jgi:hypothetical protein
MVLYNNNRKFNNKALFHNQWDVLRKHLKVFLDAFIGIVFTNMDNIWKSLCILIVIRDFNLTTD